MTEQKKLNTIFRVVKNTNYTVISNYGLRDMRLSAKALGILVKILSYSENYAFTLHSLAASFRDGVDSIRSGIRELSDAGYLLRYQERDPNGQLSRTIYLISECPIDDVEKVKEQGITFRQEPSFVLPEGAKIDKKSQSAPKLENPITVKKDAEMPTDGKETQSAPKLDFPTSVNPTSGNPMLRSTRERNNSINNIPDTSSINTVSASVYHTDAKNVVRENYLKVNGIPGEEPFCPVLEESIDEEADALVREQIGFDELMKRASFGEIRKETVEDTVRVLLDVFFRRNDDVYIRGFLFSVAHVREALFALTEKGALRAIKEAEMKGMTDDNGLLDALYSAALTDRVRGEL